MINWNLCPCSLDPTIFVYAGANNSRDLDPSDAHFVDILHTGAGILGQWQPGGHADFYINGNLILLKLWNTT